MTAVTLQADAKRSASRDEAIDVTRSIAILGMFVIHAVLVLATEYPRRGASAFVLWLCDGRAAATFVTLAGFGVARLYARHSTAVGTTLLQKRALVLWCLGVLNLIVWPGDILRVYAVALLVAPWLMRRSHRTRALVVLGLPLLFAMGMSVLDWTTHWNLNTLTYIGVWTPAGFVRNLLFDGFRPVVPWLSFFVVGTMLADWNLHDTRVQRRLIGVGIAATVAAVVASAGLDRLLMRSAPHVDALTREGLVGTTSLPPLPLFMLSALGTTSLLLGTVLLLVPRLPRAVTETLTAVGRRALTWYLWHIVVLVALFTLGLKNSISAEAAIAAGVALFVFAVVWTRMHASQAGMLETMMRNLSRTADDRASGKTPEAVSR